MAISESSGTISLSLCRKEREGGSRIAILKTLDSISNLCVAGPSLDTRSLLDLVSDCLRDLDTSPGTEFCNILLRSSCSVVKLLDLWSISASLNTRCAEFSKDLDCLLRATVP